MAIALPCRKWPCMVLLLVMVCGLGWLVWHGSISRSQTWVAFGDSITYRTAHAPPEGPWTVAVAQRTGHRIINAGVNNDTSDGLRMRLEHDVLAHHPDGVLLMIGINDHVLINANHVIKGAPPLERVPLIQYRQNLTAMVERLQQADIRVTLMTNRPLVIGPVLGPLYRLPSDASLPIAAGSPSRENCHKRLCRYNDIIRQIAASHHTGLIDLWAEVVARGDGTDSDASVLQAGIDVPGDGMDGIHLGPGGHQLLTELVAAAL